jgi:6-phosphogluconolactonase
MKTVLHLGLLVTIIAVALPAIVLQVGSADARSSHSQIAAVGRTFVYTITNPNGPNSIAAYEANSETGELIFLETYPTGGFGTGRLVDSQSPLVINSKGTHLFAVNPGSNDISVMAIRDDGSLSLVNEPVPSRGVEPASLALKDDLLYVANKGNATNPPSYSGFRVEPNGTLIRIKRRITLEVGDNPTHVLFNRDGGMLIGIRLGTGGLECFAVRPNGRLSFLSKLNNQRGPFAGVFNPVSPSQLIAADARLPGASSYLLSPEGSFSQLASVSNAPERAACWIVAHPDGHRVWVSNTGTSSLSLYTLGPNGELALASTRSTIAFGRSSFEIALDPSNCFLYQLNIGASNQSINALRLTESADSAGLAEIGAIGLPAGSSPIGLAVASR